ncbi:hypothetical protein JOC86_002259 [Bacillus pakistanensis]|uniref:DUF3311 domain-containing protein n=1 Tax=Rossellomorea pakistanensis TaxID=992288 RepID=A0ABS2NCY0_9BACI|nr:hypothetical protein [Bacillus pakistanensis]MBM7585717.1 hypothetical protein [Bacillus pakistanensis]
MEKKKEPIKNVKIWVIILGIFLLSIPWYLPEGSSYILAFGIPYWGWMVLAASLGMSIYLTYVLNHEWQMEEEETGGDQS